MGAREFADAKVELRRRLDKLRGELDRYLASEYGVRAGDAVAFEKWRTSHQPFHWFVEFYGIMKSGGFDVIIGNPPYVEYNKVRGQYSVLNFKTLECGNLYVFIIERSVKLLSTNGLTGLIVPLSFVCTKRMSEARKLIQNYQVWVSSFDIRPSSLFEGVTQRVSIVLMRKCGEQLTIGYTAGYRRWMAEERDFLMQTTVHTNHPEGLGTLNGIPKLSSGIEQSILAKISGEPLSRFRDDAGDPVYIHRIVRYFIKALTFVPLFVDSDGKKGKSEDYKEFRFPNSERSVIVALINSSLFYWFWRANADGFHCGYGDVYVMPYKLPMTAKIRSRLGALQEKLMQELDGSSQMKTIRTRTGIIRYQEFYTKSSKPIIDEIDTVLAGHYRFTDEELDFIINYDIKYRMGPEGEE
ncbi:MAG: Eco57I restriction-modification methylase domain-containing protein [Deinococcus sp.]|nr:Eco57I restriction-modification methylase domain-containing protein [Deinococcus sp.]